MIKKIICPYCGCGCALYLKIEKGKIISALPVKDDPVSEGKPCIKGLTVHEVIYSKNRIKKPMVRKNGKLREVNWEEAFEFIAKNLEKFDPSDITFYGSSPATNEDAFLFQKVAREIYKTENIDSCARLCHASTCYALKEAFGISAMPHAMLKDIKNADCILITGSNPKSNYPVAFNKILDAKKKGCKIICVKQTEDETTEYADIFVKIYPGSHIIFLNGILNELVLRNNVKVEEKISEFLMKYTEKYVCELCRIKKNDFRKVVDEIEKSKNFCLMYGMVLTQHTYGVENVFSAANLVIAKNGKIIPMRGKANIQGVQDMGLVPGKNGNTIIESVFLYPSKAFWILETNPAQSMPDLNKVHKVFRKAFIVLQCSYKNLTMEFSDVVLPSSSFAEVDGTFTSAESRVRYFKNAINPLFDSKPNWVILKEFAKYVGKHYNYTNTLSITKDIIKNVVGYNKINIEKLIKGESQFVERVIRFKKYHVAEFEGFEEPTSKDYPFILSTARRPYQFCTSDMSVSSKKLREISHPECFISEENGKEIGLEDGELICLVSRVGKIKANVRLSKKVPKNLIIVPYHYRNILVNKLIPIEFSPVVYEPNLKKAAVRVEVCKRK